MIRITSRINAHDLHGVDVLLLAHTANLRCHIRPHFAGQYQAGDGRRQLDDGAVSNDVTDIVDWHKRAIQLVEELHRCHRPYKNRDQAHNDQRTDANVVHLAHGFLVVHVVVFWPGEGGAQHHRVPPHVI